MRSYVNGFLSYVNGLLNMMFLRSAYAVPCISSLLLLWPNNISLYIIPHSLLIDSPIDGYLGCSNFFFIVNDAAMDICI